MNVYLAARYGRRLQMLGIAHALDVIDELEMIERQEAATPDFGGAAMEAAR